MPSFYSYNFIGYDTDRRDSDIVLFGAPFDSTASFRPGARFGPSAMRSQSFGLETYSPYQKRDLSEIKVHDAGDLELCIGSAEKALSDIEKYADGILSEGKLPLLLGGEHLTALGAIRAAVKYYPNMHILHLDAHTDLRDHYLGQSLSHATVMRRAWELVGDGKLHQFGIRSGDKSEYDFAKNHTDIHEFTLEGLSPLIKSLKGKPVYLSLDLDVLDPSVFPGTGTPEAGGIGFFELLNAIIELKDLEIVGADLTELCPVYDQSGVSTATACKILREILFSFTA